MRVLSIRTLNGKDQDNLVFLHDFHRSFHFIVPYNHDHVRAKHSVVHINIVFLVKSTVQLFKQSRGANV